MASLRARSRLHTGSSEVFNKLLSLSGFLVLMAAGWLALCYIRSSQERRFNTSPQSNESNVAQLATQQQVQPAVKLVYAAAEDKTYYHNPNHLPAVSERRALSEEAARRLGLRPCPICIRRESAPQSTAETERRGASESAK